MNFKMAGNTMAPKDERQMHDHEVKAMAEQVARATVKEFFLALGVNAEDPEAVIAVQRDFAHLRSWREASDTIKRKGLLTAVGIITAGMIGLIWMQITKH